MSDLTVTAANVLKSTSSSTKHGTAGATITAGQALYQDANDSYKLKLAIATSQAAANCVGISLHGASAGQPIEYTDDGDYNPGATAVVGMVYCVSANAAGAIAPYGDLASTNYVTILGGGKTASNIGLKIKALGVAKP